MSTDKSLKHLKPKDKFRIHVATVSNCFEKHSGRDSSSYVQQTFQPTGVSRKILRVNFPLCRFTKSILVSIQRALSVLDKIINARYI